MLRFVRAFAPVVAVVVGTAILASGSGAADSTSGRDRAKVAQPRTQLQIGQVIRIAGRSYGVIDPRVAIARIPHPTVKLITSLISRCRSAGAYGFGGTGPVDIGVVAWVPMNLIDCWASGDDVIGGGPTEPVPSSPCLQGFRTPDRRFYVIFAGSSVRICSHLATQAPGYAPGTTLAAVSGLPAGSRIVVKCQAQAHDGTLWDFVSTYAPRVPASKNAWWIEDRKINTGYEWYPGVPSCSGMRFQN